MAWMIVLLQQSVQGITSSSISASLVLVFHDHSCLFFVAFNVCYKLKCSSLLFCLLVISIHIYSYMLSMVYDNCSLVDGNKVTFIA